MAEQAEESHVRSRTHAAARRSCSLSALWPPQCTEEGAETARCELEEVAEKVAEFLFQNHRRTQARNRRLGVSVSNHIPRLPNECVVGQGPLPDADTQALAHLLTRTPRIAGRSLGWQHRWGFHSQR